MKRSKILAVVMGALMALSSTAFAGEWDITVFRPAVNPRDHKGDVMVRAADKYTKETGGKVTFVMGDWGNWQSKVLSHMAAGDPIDVVFCRDADFPKFYMKGYVQPLEQYVDLKGLKGFDGKKLISDKNEDSVFKYGGHYYAASHYTSNHMWIILYNKSLMEEEGIKESEQPYALWKAGKWDWDHLAALARKLTKDTAGTGSIDRWGLANWNTQAFVYMNGGEFTKTDNKTGNQTLNFEDPKVVEALTFLEKAKKEGWYQQDNNIAKDGLQNRTIAMYMEREYYASQVVTKTDDEIAYVPLPHGPSVKVAPNVFECDGYGIGNGSKKQKAAGKYIGYALQEWYIEDMKSRKTTWPQEVLDLADVMLDEGGYFPGPSNSALDSMMNEFLGEIIWTGNSPASAIEKFTPKAQALLADANKPMGKLVQLPFKGLDENFEKMSDKKIPDFASTWKDTKTAKISLVSGSQAIDGKKSLKIEFTPKDDKETGAVVVLTNPQKFGIVGWRNYKVTFKAKLVGKKLGDTASVWMKGYSDEINQYGFVSKNLDDNTKVYEVSGYINDVNQNGQLGLQIGLNGCTAVIIDDIVVSEK